MNFKVGQKVVGTPKLYKNWSTAYSQLPPNVIGEVIWIDEKEDPPIGVRWSSGHNSYYEDNLQHAIAYKLDII